MQAPLAATVTGRGAAGCCNGDIAMDMPLCQDGCGGGSLTASAAKVVPMDS